MSTPLPPNPTIQLRFTGLLVFSNNRPQDPMIVKAVDADDHALRILWIKKDKADGSTIQMTYLPTDVGQSEVRLRVTNPSSDHNGIEKHPDGTPPPPNPLSDRHAYNHLRRFTALPGNERATIISDAFHRDIIIEKGYFYSADIYQVRIGPGNNCSNNPGELVSFMVGTNVYFDPQQGTATLTFGQGTTSGVLETELEITGGKAYTYEIYVTNLPDITHLGMGNHFGHYYEAFDNVPSAPWLVCPITQGVEEHMSPSQVHLRSIPIISYMHPCIPVGI